VKGVDVPVTSVSAGAAQVAVGAVVFLAFGGTSRWAIGAPLLLVLFIIYLPQGIVGTIQARFSGARG